LFVCQRVGIIMVVKLLRTIHEFSKRLRSQWWLCQDDREKLPAWELPPVPGV